MFRHIQTYPNTIRHIRAYSGIIQAYSEPCVTLAYSEIWYIQNPGIFRTLGYSELETYSELCQASSMERCEKQGTAKIISASCNYLRNISFSSLVHEINMIFLMQV